MPKIEIIQDGLLHEAIKYCDNSQTVHGQIIFFTVTHQLPFLHSVLTFDLCPLLFLFLALFIFDLSHPENFHDLDVPFVINKHKLWWSKFYMCQRNNSKQIILVYPK